MAPPTTKSLFTTISWLSTFVAPPVVAQTWTACNPLNTTDCPHDPALSTNHTFDFLTSTAGSTWNTTAGALTYSEYEGAHFTIADRGDAPTIQTNFYIFGGEVEVWMKAATGQGVVSSIVLESDDLDEVDWEILGGNDSFVESNYFGKGNTTSYDRAVWHPVTFKPQADFHNYTTRWTKEEIEWFIDGASVRVLKYDEANGGKNFPQTPMNVRLGVWAAGDKDNKPDTITWAGGKTDYSKGPYTMTVRSTRVKDYSQGKEYVYGDMTGSWESIKIVPGNSTIEKELNAPPSLTASQRWNNLSPGAKIGVGSAVGVTSIALIVLAGIYCVRQRRAGRRERALADLEFEKERRELGAYQMQMAKGGFAVSSRPF
ncbi:MAG: hypothetical protein L6R40_008366 [Gallowayella cf. fulva]|nr:MAG: hypothetical protein L6R40_008366 [Xanthomendoza cf. fulva]